VYYIGINSVQIVSVQFQVIKANLSKQLHLQANHIFLIQFNTLPKEALMVEVCIGTKALQNDQQYGCQTGNKLKDKSCDLNYLQYKQ